MLFSIKAMSFFSFICLFLKPKSNIFRFFYISMLRLANLFFAFKNNNCRVYHECAFELTDWIIWLVHQLWLVYLNKYQLFKILLAACNYYYQLKCKCPLGMFKNVPHVRNKIWLHVKYLLNVNSIEIIWSSFLLLLLIKNAIKMLLLLLSVYIWCA